jgi:hypothetical protein
MTYPLLLSERAAAKLLGISRGDPGLSSLLKRGVLQKVVVDGKEYLSRSQLEEFARVGEAPAPPRKRREKKREPVNLDSLDAEF